MSNPSLNRKNFQLTKRFTFRVNSPDVKLREVKANNYDQAAVLAARKMFGNGSTAMRVYGFPDFSGYFQAYIYVSTSTGNQIRYLGKTFHLQMLFDKETDAIPDYNFYVGLKTSLKKLR